MVGCCILKCSSASLDKKGISFFSIPKVIMNQCDKTRALSEERRKLWIQRINRKDFFSKPRTIEPRVCSLHFLSGQKANLFDSCNVDWAPSIRLGYETSKLNVKSVSRDQARLERRKRRNAAASFVNKRDPQTLFLAPRDSKTFETPQDPQPTQETEDYNNFNHFMEEGRSNSPSDLLANVKVEIETFDEEILCTSVVSPPEEHISMQCESRAATSLPQPRTARKPKAEWSMPRWFQCYVCQQRSDDTPQQLSSGKAKNKSQTSYPQCLGEILRSKYSNAVIDCHDEICKKCIKLIDMREKLREDLQYVEQTILSHLENRIESAINEYSTETTTNHESFTPFETIVVPSQHYPAIKLEPIDETDPQFDVNISEPNSSINSKSTETLPLKQDCISNNSKKQSQELINSNLTKHVPSSETNETDPKNRCHIPEPINSTHSETVHVSSESNLSKISDCEIHMSEIEKTAIADDIIPEITFVKNTNGKNYGTSLEKQVSKKSKSKTPLILRPSYRIMF